MDNILFRYLILEKVIVNEEKAEKLESFFRQYHKYYDVLGFRDVRLDIVKNNKGESELKEIIPTDEMDNFRDGWLFANKLSEIMERGTILLWFFTLTGEKWGYLVKPNSVKAGSFVFMLFDDMKRKDIQKYVIDAEDLRMKHLFCGEFYEKF